MARFIVLQVIAGIVGGIIAAKKERAAVIWGLLCFIFPLLVIVIAMLPPLNVPAGRICPKCSRPIGEHERICSSCGDDKPIELVQCPTCGSYIAERNDCPVCDRPKE